MRNTQNSPTGPRGRISFRTISAAPRATVLLFAGCLWLSASSFSLDHEAKIQYDLGETQVPVWSGGALVNFVSNQTSAPTILSFNDQGHQLPPLVLAIPERETIDVDDVASGTDGAVVACGSSYVRSGRGAGFLAVFTPTGETATVIRLSPYFPSRIAVASDGTIWTAGLELTNAKDSPPPGGGVLRHFDRAGKVLGSFIPRSAFSSPLMVRYGMLRSARGRIGWHTGPIAGPGSRYYEILSDGTVRQYPALALGPSERVNGLGLTDDGSTYLTTLDRGGKHRFLSIGGPGESRAEPLLPGGFDKVFLYGAEGHRLVFFFRDRFTVAFVNVSD